MTTTQHQTARGADRRARRRYVFIDRRSGFERRHQPRPGWWSRLLNAYRANPRLLPMVLTIFLALNLADLIFTQMALSAGAIEANPFMAKLFAQQGPNAAIVKIGVGVGVVALTMLFRRHRRMLAMSLFATGIYGIVFVYHLNYTVPLVY